MADRVGQQLGNYHLVKLLGQGGFAEVYLGEHRYLKSQAALKVLHTALEDKQAEQFLAEAQTLVRLVHPNIVRVLDFTIEQGTPVLVMDYAPERTLRHQHPAGTCLPLATVVSYVTQIAAALQYAHNHNLIHRDVKPENMLLGPAHNVLLSDFGLALFAPSPEVLSRQEMAGTILYMAPEQLQGHPRFASDQYALGVVAYEWLCGSRPFAGSSWHLIHQHVYAAPPPLRKYNPSVPASVEAVVLRALAKDPRDRYVSVQAFALALDRTQRETVPSDEEDSQITASLKALPRSSFALSPPHTPTDTESPQGMFLAASSADEAVAARLKDDMEAQGIIVWNERLRNTPNVLEQADGLRQEIRAASLVLVLLSPHTRSSSTVTESIRIANLYERRMVFVWVAGEEIAALLPLSQTWGTTAVIDVIDAREASYERALTEIIVCLGEEPTLTTPLLPAFAESQSETSPLDTPPTIVLRGFAQNVVSPQRTNTFPSQQQPQTEQTVSPSRDVNRKRLLAKVRAFWITGVLEHSLHGAALIALGLHAQPAAVTDPWHLVLKSPGEPAQALAPGTQIAQVYDDAVGELLILGQPGSGKTTLLLELARTLLDRASQDESHPMPVVFNLSSWAVERQPLTEWLVAELNSKYQVPRKLAQSWIDTDHILPLLDGLDEVSPTSRAACVEAINIYRLSHGLVPTVVCSRSTEYLAQTVHVLLRNAVVVQPLTTQQIDAYLSNAGEQLESLRAALHADAALQELATTPLVLSVLTLAYHGKPVAELLAAHSPEMQRRQVFDAYITRVLEHRGTDTRYTPQQTLHWLSWLARQMKQHSQTVFYIEQLQFDWLSGDRMLHAYDWLGIRLPGMLIGALVGLAITAFLLFPNLSIGVISIMLGGLLGDIWSGRRAVRRFVVSDGKARSVLWLRILQWLGIGVLIGLIIASALWLTFPPQNRPSHFLNFGLWCYGLSFGLWNVLLQLLREKSSTAENSCSSLATMWQFLVRLIRSPGVGTGLLFVLISGTIFTLVYGLVIGQFIGLLVGLFTGLIVGLFVGLLVGLSSGLLSALLMRQGVMVQLVDQLIWSWGNLGMKLFSKRHVRLTILCGLIFGLASMLINVLIQVLSTGLTLKLVYLESGLLLGLINGLTTGLGYWLLLGFWQGVSSATIEDQRRVVPNQGVRHSAYNSLVLGLVSTLIVGLTYVLRKWLEDTLPATQGVGLLARLFTVGVPTTGALTIGTLSAGLFAGLFAGLVAGLLNGGLACLRHDVLRFLLWHAESMPWNYPRFLDYAAERILLRKVGGGYIFVHRLLLEYFASLDSTPTRAATRAQKQPALPMSREMRGDR